jgi:hypothetical protein
LARGSDSTTSADLPSDEDIRKDLDDLKKKFFLELTAKQQGDQGHYNMILKSLNSATLESEQSVDRQEVGEVLSVWDATMTWLEGEQESASTMTRPLSARSVAVGSAAVALAAGSFFGGSLW